MNRGVLSRVNDALIGGLDGTILSNGDRLTVDKKPDSIEQVSDDVLPFLLTDVGTMTFAPWQFWDEFVNWDVKATLKIKGEPGEVDDLILDVVLDLVAQMKRIMGLPVDDSGSVIAYGPETRRLFDQDELKFLVERGAPYLKSAAARPSEGPYCVADLVIHLETTVNVDPRGELPRAQVAILGVSSAQGSIAADPSLPDPQSIAVVGDRDVHAWGGYDTDAPRGSRRRVQQRVAGVPDRERIKQVVVAPHSVALSAGAPTSQLAAIAYQNNWASAYVTAQSSWTSSDQTVATVTATGLVTRVAAGSATVLCTYQGVASSAVAVVCS